MISNPNKFVFKIFYIKMDSEDFIELIEHIIELEDALEQVIKQNIIYLPLETRIKFYKTFSLQELIQIYNRLLDTIAQVMAKTR
jgi:hypothetical protein